MIIGKINIDRPIWLAPMEDVTDQSFRIICKRLGADVLCTEFINSEGLVRNNQKTHKKMMFRDEEHPIGIQIYGSDENSMSVAAKMAEENQPDFIDINCGCWVKKVVGSGAGSGLLKDIPKMEKIVTEVVKSVKLPVTVKTRLGWDLQSIKIVDVAKMLEQCGVSAITIHCRTRAQAHNGEPDFSWIAKIKEQVKIPIVANGSLDTPEKIFNVFNQTNCDGVMIGREAIYNPWIFNQVKLFMLDKQSISEPNIEERFYVLLQHLNLAAEIKGERKGVIEFRKHYSGYLKGLHGAAKIRQELMNYVELSPIINCLSDYKNHLLSY